MQGQEGFIPGKPAHFERGGAADTATSVNKTQLFRLVENRQDFEGGNKKGMILKERWTQWKLLNAEMSALSCF